MKGFKHKNPGLIKGLKHKKNTGVMKWLKHKKTQD
jgi:hypothetical protein